MSLFQCENCGCSENTALSYQGHNICNGDGFDWTGKEALKGKKICSACGPTHFSDGGVNKKGGKWHGQFDQVYLPIGMFETDKEGNLAHIETGDTDYRKYQITKEK